MSDIRYTYDEAIAASKEYFGGDDFVAKVFVDKYCLNEDDKGYVDLTPLDMHKRLAGEFARIDSEKYGLDYNERYEIYLDALIKFQRIVPQGSVMSAVGNPYKIMSASNCVVIASPEDSIEGIFHSGKEMAQLYKRRCVEENTLVFILGRGYIAIKDVNIGDMIASLDVKAERRVFREVKDKFSTEVNSEDRIKIQTNSGIVLKTSRKHPILIDTETGYEYKSVKEGIDSSSLLVNSSFNDDSAWRGTKPMFEEELEHILQTLTKSEISYEAELYSTINQIIEERKISYVNLLKLHKYNLITDRIKNLVQVREVINSIVQDESSTIYYDIEVDETNNFFAGNEYGEVNIHNCGVGIDISTLRPEGHAVSNAAKTTSGAWSFADFFSYVTRMIGQCVAKGQRVLTKRGLVNIEDVIPNEDYVWTKKGWIKVLSVFANGEKQIFTIKTKEGLEVKTSKDHIFLTDDNGKLIEKTLESFKVGDSIITIPGTTDRDEEPVQLDNHVYEVSEIGSKDRLLNQSLTFPKVMSEDLAYFLGYTYGDGYVPRNKKTKPMGISVSCPHDRPEIEVKLTQIIKELFNYDARSRQGDGALNKLNIYSVILSHWLQVNGILKEKSYELNFPEKILKSSSSIQMAFLSGLFDADGHASGQKKGYVWTTVCYPLATEVQKVLNANGIMSKIHTEDRTKKGWRNLYTVSVVGNTAQQRLVDLMSTQSSKVAESMYVASRDSSVTPYFAYTSLGVKVSNHSYVNNSQKISAKAMLKLAADTGEDFGQLLICNTVSEVKESGVSETFDLELESEHLFWCEGFYVHNSGRRGALMVTLNVHHPDILKFIKMKEDKTKVTGANVSVQLTDEFLKAVDEDTEYEQRWPIEKGTESFSRKVSAREIWEAMIESATVSAEPGLMFIDTIRRELPADYYDHFKTVTTNPCLTADTMIAVADGRGEVSIGELAKEGSNVPVVAINEHGEVCVKIMRKPRLTGKDKEVYKITVDGGHSFKVTFDHRLMTDVGRFVEAGKLNVGDTLQITRANPIGSNLEPMNADNYTWWKEVESSLIEHDNRSIFERFTRFKDRSKIQKCAITSITYAGEEDVYNGTVDDLHSFLFGAFKEDSSTLFFNSKNCGELPLGKNGSCRLTSLNLTGYVKNAFKDNAQFDMNLFKSDVKLAMQILDNVVDLELENIIKIQAQADSEDEKATWQGLYDSGKRGRRTGLGTHGLADTLAQLNIKYDSDEGIAQIRRIYKMLRDASYEASVDLAETRGAFEEWDWEKEKDCPFIKRLPRKLRERMAISGRRNISLLTQAPTGSVSIVSKCGEFNTHNISSGVEPVFMNSYVRRKKINAGDESAKVDFVDELGDQWQEFTIHHGNVKNYLDSTGYDESKGLPDFFVTSEDIDWAKRVEIQQAEQEFIDHSISSTINLPRGTSVETVGGIYMHSWKMGLKGVTVYVDGSRDGVLIAESKDESRDENGRPTLITHVQSPRRPDELPCTIHQATAQGTPWTVLLGMLGDDPYEMFMGHSEALSLPKKCKHGKIVKVRKGVYDLHVNIGEDDNLIIKNIVKVFDNPDSAWATRMISIALRHGTPLEFIVEQLAKDGGITDVNKVCSRILKKFLRDGARVSSGGGKCPECGDSSLIYVEGCMTCTSCGYSKCS